MVVAAAHLFLVLGVEPGGVKGNDKLGRPGVEREVQSLASGGKPIALYLRRLRRIPLLNTPILTGPLDSRAAKALWDDDEISRPQFAYFDPSALSKIGSIRIAVRESSWVVLKHTVHHADPATADDCRPHLVPLS